MLTVHQLYKSYGIQPILQNISFSLSNGERVGLIGPNGCGKTTLLRILMGLETADAGSVIPTHPNLRIGYLAQGMELDPESTLQTALGPAPVKPEELEAEIVSLAVALSSNPNDLALQARYDTAITQLSATHHPLSTGERSEPCTSETILLGVNFTLLTNSPSSTRGKTLNGD